MNPKSLDGCTLLIAFGEISMKDEEKYEEIECKKCYGTGMDTVYLEDLTYGTGPICGECGGTGRIKVRKEATPPKSK